MVTSCPKAFVEPKINITVPITTAVNLNESIIFFKVSPL